MPDLSRNQQIVLAYVRCRNDGCTTAEVAYHLGICSSNTRYILNRLIEHNLIFRADNPVGRNSRRLFFPTQELADINAGRKPKKMVKNDTVFDACRQHSKNYQLTQLLRGAKSNQ